MSGKEEPDGMKPMKFNVTESGCNHLQGPLLAPCVLENIRMQIILKLELLTW